MSSFFVKELCLCIRENGGQRRLERNKTCNSNCPEKSVQDTNCDDSCSSAFGGAKKRLADRHRRLERSAMRDPTTARCNNDASTSFACLCKVKNETFDARIRKCKNGKNSKGESTGCADRSMKIAELVEKCPPTTRHKVK